jgi:hypothetical protein
MPATKNTTSFTLIDRLGKFGNQVLDGGDYL